MDLPWLGVCVCVCVVRSKQEWEAGFSYVMQRLEPNYNVGWGY